MDRRDSGPLAGGGALTALAAGSVLLALCVGFVASGAAVERWTTAGSASFSLVAGPVAVLGAGWSLLGRRGATVALVVSVASAGACAAAAGGVGLAVLIFGLLVAFAAVQARHVRRAG